MHYLNCSKKWKARSIFVEKGFSAKDDGIALKNIYYEAAPPSPQGDNVLFWFLINIADCITILGSVHSVMMEFVQDFEGSNDDDDGKGKDQF